MASNGRLGIAAVAVTMMLAASHGHHHGGNPLVSLMSSASSVLDSGGHNLNTRSGWARAFLAAAGEPVTRCNRRVVVQWEIREGGGFGNQAANNPLNVNPGPGAGWPGYNATGAWAFPDPQTGLNYTVQTIRNGNYGPVLDALSQGNDPQGVVNAIVASPWAGSHYGWSWPAPAC